MQFLTFKKEKCLPKYFFLFIVSYLEYFTTPYFVFFRDTLSYLVLLGFHFALCLETSSIPFSGLEWAILVFFLSRILNEIKQFLDVKIKRKKKTGIKNSEGSKYNIRFENGVESSKRQGKSVIFLQKCGKYLRYHVIGLKRRRSTCGSSKGSLF